MYDVSYEEGNGEFKDVLFVSFLNWVIND